jgi:exopolysaccharide biosynthesis polyprenyl glycosylphosphotransferase
MSFFASRPELWRALRLGGDLAVGAFALYLAFQLRVHLPLPLTTGRLPPERADLYLPAALLPVLGVRLLAHYFLGLYDPPHLRRGPAGARELARATALAGLGLMGTFFLADRSFPRSVLLLFLALDFLLVLAWRRAIDAFHRVPLRRVALVGSGAAAQEIAENIRRYHWHGLEVAGYVPSPEEGPAGTASPPSLGPCLGGVGDLPGLLQQGAVDDIVLTGSPYRWQTDLIDRLVAARPRHGSVLLLPGPFESLIGRMRYRWVHDVPLVEVMRESEWRLDRPVKRGLDLGLGLLLLLLATPLLLFCVLVIRFASPGPILYRQIRVGRGQRLFTLWKFRTMRVDAEAAGAERLATAGDERLVPGGALMRRSRLDEIPQLFNVLAGSMSLVGPRPERPGFVERFLREVPGYAERFLVPPGLTGLAQVNGEYHSSPANKLRYDLAYLANWSLWLDLSILFRTVKIVLTSRGV